MPRGVGSLSSSPLPVSRRVAVGHREQYWADSAEARDLDVAGVLPDVWVVERAGAIRLFEAAPIHDVVEDHRNAEAAELDRGSGAVRQREPKHEVAALDRPGANDSERRSGGKAGGYVGREVAGVRGNIRDRLAVKVGRDIGPLGLARGAEAEIEVA